MLTSVTFLHLQQRKLVRFGPDYFHHHHRMTVQYTALFYRMGNPTEMAKKSCHPLQCDYATIGKNPIETCANQLVVINTKRTDIDAKTFFIWQARQAYSLLSMYRFWLYMHYKQVEVEDKYMGGKPSPWVLHWGDRGSIFDCIISGVFPIVAPTSQWGVLTFLCSGSELSCIRRHKTWVAWLSMSGNCFTYKIIASY